MTRVEQIEKEIASLSQEELEDFRRWFQEFDATAWDQQIEADATSGRLEKLADEALHEHGAGKSTQM